jgi:hypothetical protein
VSMAVVVTMAMIMGVAGMVMMMAVMVVVAQI